jgi:hypothetical protein
MIASSSAVTLFSWSMWVTLFSWSMWMMVSSSAMMTCNFYKAIKEIQGLGLNIKDQGHPADYVGVRIKKHCDGFYEFTQRALIDSIIEDAGISNSKTKPVPAKVSIPLTSCIQE